MPAVVIRFLSLPKPVFGGWQSPCDVARLGQVSCVMSPYPSPSASGSTVAETLSRKPGVKLGKLNMFPGWGSLPRMMEANWSPGRFVVKPHGVSNVVTVQSARASPAATGIRLAKVLTPVVDSWTTSLDLWIV